jgi:hypothetical protein
MEKVLCAKRGNAPAPFPGRNIVHWALQHMVDRFGLELTLALWWSQYDYVEVLVIMAASDKDPESADEPFLGKSEVQGEGAS